MVKEVRRAKKRLRCVGGEPVSAELNKNQGLLDAALEIAAARANTLREIKELLLKNEDAKALRLMRQHLGIQDRKLKLIK